MRFKTRVGYATIWAALIALVVTLFGCSEVPEVDSEPTARNVVILVLDTLRTTRMATYGNERPTTPRIDQLADQGALFELALSQSNWTVPATASILTSLYPSEHGAGVKGNEEGILLLDKTPLLPLREETLSLAQILSDAGFRTALLSANPFLFGRFQRGFDLADVDRVDASTLTERAIRFLEAADARPFLLYIQYMDLHQPHTPPDPYFNMFGKETPGERGEIHRDWLFGQHHDGQSADFENFRNHKIAVYDGTLRYLDNEIGRLLDAVDQLGLADETLVVLTADHGEEFWDHADQERVLAEDPRGIWGVGHGHSMYQELLWVPLVLRGPGIGAGHRIDCPARLVDIMPTALEILGLPSPDRIRGVSLAPLVTTGPRDPVCKPRASLAESPAYGPPSKSIVFGRYKLVWRPNGLHELFDLATDPGELSDLAEERPGVVAQLTKMMQRELARIDYTDSEEPVEFDAHTREQLRTLGYVD